MSSLRSDKTRHIDSLAALAHRGTFRTLASEPAS
jgi:hypothetical protein